MAGTAQRVTIIIIAAVFFITSVAVSILVIVEAVQNKDGTVNTETQTGGQPDQNAPKLAGFTPVNEVRELQVTDPKAGDGATISSAEQTVTVDYTGAVAATGAVFDSSQGQEPLVSPLTNLIPGWQEGMIGMKVGGQRRMLIPAELAYGANPPQGSGIPANAPLVFDVTLKEVK